MLNTALIAEFRTVQAGSRSGTLEVALGERKVRFGFEAGDLVLLDLGEEKELAMARKFLDYHKIAPEIHRHALATSRASGASIVDSLRRQQLVSESEVQQVARAMVEDMLSLCFGVAHTSVAYKPDEGADTYDLDRRAVRLKIDIPTLISGVEARIKEEDDLLRRIGGYNSVFVLDEAANPDQLDEFERHLLNFIDGRKSVDAIAIAFRDSSPNMAKHLVTLLDRGFIRRGATLSERRSAVSAATPSPGEPIPAPIVANEVERPFEIFRPTAPPPAISFGTRVVLGTLLAVLLVVGLAVVIFGRQQATVSSLLSSIETDIASRQWETARVAIDGARAAMGNDLATKRRVDDLQKRLADGLDAEAMRIDQAISDQDFAEAGRRLTPFPASHPRQGELKARYDLQNALFETRTAALAREVAVRAEAGDIPGALNLIDGARPAEAAAAEQVLDHWRKNSIETAKLSSKGMGERQALLNHVRSARPTDYQRQQIERAQEELARGQNRRLEQLKAVRVLVDQGAYARAGDEITRQRLLDQAPGSPLMTEAQQLATRTAEVKVELEGYATAHTAALASASDTGALAALRERLIAALVRYPDASNRTDLVALGQLLDQLMPLIGRGSSAEESLALAALLKEQPAGSELSKALAARVAALNEAGTEAQRALDDARRLGREGKWDESITAMERIAKTVAWRRTPVGQGIDQDLVQARIARTRQDQLMARFREALGRGDVANAHELARELGLRYLPLLVESVPSGAEVLRDGKPAGRTPLVLEVNAGERADLTLQVRAVGFEPATLSGAEATGGWRLSAWLVRTPRLAIDLAIPLSTTPTAIDGSLWLAGATHAAAITHTGAITTYALVEPGVRGPDQGLRAAAVRFDDGVWLATRDGFAVRIAGDRRERLALPGPTDFPPLSYRSPLVLDRRFLVVAGTDGALHASDPRDANGGWHAAAGAVVIAPPVLVGDRVLIARGDGTLEAALVDGGALARSVALGAPLLAAWPTASGLAGLTRDTAWTWDGTGEAVRTPLPREAVVGGDGVIVTRDRQVLTLQPNGDWTVLGLAASTVTGKPLRWQGRAVLPCGQVAQVLGDVSFQVRARGTFLDPLLLGDELVLVSSAGEVFVYAP